MEKPAHPPRKPPLPRSNSALMHELQVHQVELEMQNEELRQTQVKLAAARDLFSDLYDLAPVGYLTIDRQGMVISANLTAAAMLGVDRKTLQGKHFARCIVAADADLWYHHLAHSWKADASQRVELALRRQSGEPLHAQLDCLLVVAEGAPPTLRVTITDNTQRRQAETDRRIAESAVAAIEAERRTVARELHEELGQCLSVLKMELASLGTAADHTSRETRIAEMQGALDEAVRMVRRIATGLRPMMLDDLGLNAAIDWLARDTARRLGLELRLHLVDVDPPLDEQTAVAIYRMAQDILAHVAQNAHATRVSIDLRKRADTLVLTVQTETDDARGAPLPSRPKAEATSLLALGDRAHLLGGRLELGEVPGSGTRVCVRLPMARSARARPAPSRQESA